MTSRHDLTIEKAPHLAAEPSRLVNRLGCEVAYRDSLSGQHSPVARTQVCRCPQFFRTCCRGYNDTCQAPFRPVAFGLGPYCWPPTCSLDFVSCRTITQLHDPCSTLREALMAWHRLPPKQTRRATIKIISEPAYTVWRVSTNNTA